MLWSGTKKYALTEGPKPGVGRELMWATRSAPLPPSHFMPARGLDLKIEQNMANID